MGQALLHSCSSGTMRDCVRAEWNGCGEGVATMLLWCGGDVQEHV